MVESLPVVDVLGVPIATIDLDRAATRIEQLIKHDSRIFVAAVNVHGIMESEDDPCIKACVLSGGSLRSRRDARRVDRPAAWTSANAKGLRPGRDDRAPAALAIEKFHTLFLGRSLRNSRAPEILSGSALSRNEHRGDMRPSFSYHD